MKQSTISLLVFGIYLAVLSLCLLFWPALFLHLGFESAPMPWVAITGYLLGLLAFFYFMAVVSANSVFYSWTVFARLPLLPFSLLLVLMDAAPSVMLLLGLIDLLGAVWTAWALRHERQG